MVKIITNEYIIALYYILNQQNIHVTYLLSVYFAFHVFLKTSFGAEICRIKSVEWVKTACLVEINFFEKFCVPSACPLICLDLKALVHKHIYQTKITIFLLDKDLKRKYHLRQRMSLNFKLGILKVVQFYPSYPTVQFSRNYPKKSTFPSQNTCNNLNTNSIFSMLSQIC